ncbi:MAG: mechanosensitive ion channel [Bacteroidia bacterium]|jgi:small conductance mechanosensitive channel|nr:mechanosensitive ion channel [Bacteroidia bacterium]
MDITTSLQQLSTLAVAYAPKLALAILTLIAGFWLAGRLGRLVATLLERRSLDAAVRTFLSDLTGMLIKVMVVVTAADMIGIETTSFVAILGAAGLAVGLALQGSLANFAGGVMILLFKPFRVDDLIQAQGYTGHVRAINLFVTTLETPDSKTVVIPNGPLSNGIITNLSTIGSLLVEIKVLVGYDADLAKVREVTLQACRANPKVLQTPAPTLNVLEMGAGSVTLSIRPYATTADYWDVYFGLQEQLIKAFNENGIANPIPHQVVIEA